MGLSIRGERKLTSSLTLKQYESNKMHQFWTSSQLASLCCLHHRTCDGCPLKLQRYTENKKIWIHFVKSDAEKQRHSRPGNVPAQRNSYVLEGSKGQVNNLAPRFYGTVCARIGVGQFILGWTHSALWGFEGCTPTQRAEDDQTVSYLQCAFWILRLSSLL